MEKNRNFIIKCGNCGNEMILKDKIDTIYTRITLMSNRDFTLEITCNECENSIETE